MEKIVSKSLSHYCILNSNQCKRMPGGYKQHLYAIEFVQLLVED